MNILNFISEELGNDVAVSQVKRELYSSIQVGVELDVVKSKLKQTLSIYGEIGITDLGGEKLIYTETNDWETRDYSFSNHKVDDLGKLTKAFRDAGLNELAESLQLDSEFVYELFLDYAKDMKLPTKYKGLRFKGDLTVEESVGLKLKNIDSLEAFRGIHFISKERELMSSLFDKGEELTFEEVEQFKTNLKTK